MSSLPASAPARIRPVGRAGSAARPSASRLVLGVLLLAGLLPGCGLFDSPAPIGFRSYVLQDVSVAETYGIVDGVTRSFALAKWGGVGMTWEEGNTRLHLDPVYDGKRRLRLYIELVPQGPDVNVQMFALVETLQLGGTVVGWTDPKQDVPLEEDLYQAYVDALVARRAGTGLAPPAGVSGNGGGP